MDLSHVTITERAKEMIQATTEPGQYIKISLERTGCCGYTFMLYPDVKKADDELVEIDGVKMLITSRAKEMLFMATIDYGRKGIRKGFWVTPK